MKSPFVSFSPYKDVTAVQASLFPSTHAALKRFHYWHFFPARSWRVHHVKHFLWHRSLLSVRIPECYCWVYFTQLDFFYSVLWALPLEGSIWAYHVILFDSPLSCPVGMRLMAVPRVLPDYPLFRVSFDPDSQPWGRSLSPISAKDRKGPRL